MQDVRDHRLSWVVNLTALKTQNTLPVATHDS